MTTTPLIEAQGVKKSYWIDEIETPVLRGVDLALKPRALTAILGSSGAGKSTLMHVLSSLDAPTEGRVLFEGRSLYEKKDEDIAAFRNRTMGFVFQFHHLLPEFTAVENAMMPLLVRGEAKGRAREQAEGLLAKLGLECRSHHRPAELSGGEQQRVAVARALIGNPRILFADEPTGNLDEENGRKLTDLLLKLHGERDMALVMVTHNPAVAERFPEKVRLEDGRVGRA